MRPLGKAELGATTFCASTFSNDECGANGLPLTPNSIKILGRFQRLKNLDHLNICRYVDLVRCKHERLIVVSEHYRNNLASELKLKTYCKSHEKLIVTAYEIIRGLDFLHNNKLVVYNLCAQNILLDPEGHVKLSKYGRYEMTVFGEAVPFPISTVRYTSPEIVAAGCCRHPTNARQNEAFEDDTFATNKYRVSPHSYKADIWSLGIVLAQAAFGVILWPHLSITQLVHKITNMATADKHRPLDIIAAEHNVQDILKDLPTEVTQLIHHCLTVDVHLRLTSEDLLKLPLFLPYKSDQPDILNGPNALGMFSLRCNNLQIEEDADDTDEDHLAGRNLEEVYYLWRLAGGDLEVTLKRAALIRSKPPIMNLPSFVLDNGEQFGQQKDSSILLDDTVVLLPQDQLRQRLKSVDPASYYPLLEEECEPSSLPTSPSSVDLSETSKLPLVIREKDVEYQFHRMVLFSRLLTAYPYSRPRIWKEARVDIPPLLRAHVWAAVLEIEGDVQGRYDAIDKETPTPTDRQIEVDVPRCHQYNELFSSPEGHIKFKRLLKAWILSHPEYVYWQGLDSLCAPFLQLNFNDEAVAFACLDAFIPKYLHKIFLKDNAQVIQEYLAVFTHLITFHDPELSNHLNNIGFIPDLYAIPWFLTMYTHVFPLHKIFHLWDTLLLGTSSFPLFIGVAILQQLRSQLLDFGFNECILLFSDMPEIDIERCVQDSVRLFCGTPRSTTYRVHARPSAASRTNKRTSMADFIKNPVSLADLKTEKCSRLTSDDLLDLCDLTPAGSPNKRTKHNGRAKVLVIDVRAAEEYERGTIPGSVNVPFLSAFSADDTLVSSTGVNTLNQSKQLVKVVMGASRGDHAVTFAEKLVALNYSKVCVLHKGIDSVHAAGILTVPTPEL